MDEDQKAEVERRNKFIQEKLTKSILIAKQSLKDGGFSSAGSLEVAILAAKIFENVSL